MKLTAEMVAAAYELLRLTPPFNRWGLPPSSDIKFSVTQHKDRHADWYYDGQHHIRVSANHNNYLPTVLLSVAHEMVHVRDHMTGGRRDVSHGAQFRRQAAQVCRHHGFDPGAF